MVSQDVLTSRADENYTEAEFMKLGSLEPICRGCRGYDNNFYRRCCVGKMRKKNANTGQNLIRHKTKVCRAFSHFQRHIPR